MHVNQTTTQQHAHKQLFYNIHRSHQDPSVLSFFVVDSVSVSVSSADAGDFRISVVLLLLLL